MRVVLGFSPTRQHFIIPRVAVEIPAHPTQLPLVLISHVDKQGVTAVILDLHICCCLYCHHIFDFGNVAQRLKGVGQFHSFLVNLKMAKKEGLGAVKTTHVTKQGVRLSLHDATMEYRILYLVATSALLV